MHEDEKKNVCFYQAWSKEQQQQGEGETGVRKKESIYSKIQRTKFGIALMPPTSSSSSSPAIWSTPHVVSSLLAEISTRKNVRAAIAPPPTATTAGVARGGRKIQDVSMKENIKGKKNQKEMESSSSPSLPPPSTISSSSTSIPLLSMTGCISDLSPSLSKELDGHTVKELGRQREKVVEVMGEEKENDGHCPIHISTAASTTTTSSPRDSSTTPLPPPPPPPLPLAVTRGERKKVYSVRWAEGDSAEVPETWTPSARRAPTDGVGESILATGSSTLCRNNSLTTRTVILPTTPITSILNSKSSSLSTMNQSNDNTSRSGSGGRGGTFFHSNIRLQWKNDKNDPRTSKMAKAETKNETILHLPIHPSMEEKAVPSVERNKKSVKEEEKDAEMRMPLGQVPPAPSPPSLPPLRRTHPEVVAPGMECWEQNPPVGLGVPTESISLLYPHLCQVVWESICSAAESATEMATVPAEATPPPSSLKKEGEEEEEAAEDEGEEEENESTPTTTTPTKKKKGRQRRSRTPTCPTRATPPKDSSTGLRSLLLLSSSPSPLPPGSPKYFEFPANKLYESLCDEVWDVLSQSMTDGGAERRATGRTATPKGQLLPSRGEMKEKYKEPPTSAMIATSEEKGGGKVVAEEEKSPSPHTPPPPPSPSSFTSSLPLLPLTSRPSSSGVTRVEVVAEQGGGTGEEEAVVTRHHFPPLVRIPQDRMRVVYATIRERVDEALSRFSQRREETTVEKEKEDGEERQQLSTTEKKEEKREEEDSTPPPSSPPSLSPSLSSSSAVLLPTPPPIGCYHLHPVVSRPLHSILGTYPEMRKNFIAQLLREEEEEKEERRKKIQASEGIEKEEEKKKRRKLFSRSQFLNRLRFPLEQWEYSSSSSCEEEEEKTKNILSVGALPSSLPFLIPTPPPPPSSLLLPPSSSSSASTPCSSTSSVNKEIRKAIFIQRMLEPYPWMASSFPSPVPHPHSAISSTKPPNRRHIKGKRKEAMPNKDWMRRKRKRKRRIQEHQEEEEEQELQAAKPTASSAAGMITTSTSFSIRTVPPKPPPPPSRPFLSVQWRRRKKTKRKKPHHHEKEEEGSLSLSSSSLWLSFCLPPPSSSPLPGTAATTQPQSLLPYLFSEEARSRQAIFWELIEERLRLFPWPLHLGLRYLVGQAVDSMLEEEKKRKQPQQDRYPNPPSPALSLPPPAICTSMMISSSSSSSSRKGIFPPLPFSSAAAAPLSPVSFPPRLLPLRAAISPPEVLAVLQSWEKLPLSLSSSSASSATTEDPLAETQKKSICNGDDNDEDAKEEEEEGEQDEKMKKKRKTRREEEKRKKGGAESNIPTSSEVAISSSSSPLSTTTMTSFLSSSSDPMYEAVVLRFMKRLQQEWNHQHPRKMSKDTDKSDDEKDTDRSPSSSQPPCHRLQETSLSSSRSSHPSCASFKDEENRERLTKEGGGKGEGEEEGKERSGSRREGRMSSGSLSTSSVPHHSTKSPERSRHTFPPTQRLSLVTTPSTSTSSSQKKKTLSATATTKAAAAPPPSISSHYSMGSLVWLGLQHPAAVEGQWYITRTESFYRNILVQQEEQCREHDVMSLFCYEHRLRTTRTLPLEHFLRHYIHRFKGRKQFFQLRVEQLEEWERQCRAEVWESNKEDVRQSYRDGALSSLLWLERYDRREIELLHLRSAYMHGVIGIRLREQVERFPILFGEWGKPVLWRSVSKGLARIAPHNVFWGLWLCEQHFRARIIAEEEMEGIQELMCKLQLCKWNWLDEQPARQKIEEEERRSRVALQHQIFGLMVFYFKRDVESYRAVTFDVEIERLWNAKEEPDPFL